MRTRKNIRLKGYDYSQNGVYFLTFCVEKRHEILSKVVGADALDTPFIELMEYGKILEKFIKSSNNIYPFVKIENYVIMPNHVHLLVVVDFGENGTSRASSPTKEEVPKLVSAIKRLTNKEIGFNIWQRSYHDHIIKNQEDYIEKYKYIKENPSNWQEDCYYRQTKEVY